MITIPHLETDITTACQLSCVACNHLVPLYRHHGVWRSDPEQISADLNHLSTFLHADKWGALGGEPLLHPQLPSILTIVRDSNICDEIEVWTNGLLLPRMSPDFWSSPFDTIILSVYDGKHTDESIDSISSLCLTHNKSLTIKDERTWHNFRTNLEPSPTDPDATKLKYDGCFFRSFSRVANRGYFFTCCCAPHMPALIQDRPFGSDGILISTSTEQSISAYLSRSEPLGACTICAGRDTAKPITWSEQRDPKSWLAQSSGL